MSLEAITSVDGRYKKITAPLAQYFSEQALIRYRIIVEGEYLIALSEQKSIGLRPFSVHEKKLIRGLYALSTEDAQKVKELESVTNHDVKAVEYFMKEKLGATSLKRDLEWIHFALTSEDTNNLAYALMLSESLRDVIIPALTNILRFLDVFALEHKGLAMLARTHGQSASPTTLGKEFKVFSARVARQLKVLKATRILVKLNGATGNYNAHVAAYPKLDWMKFTSSFVTKLSLQRKIHLEPNLITTQIEPHDTYAELFDVLRRINIILIDCNQDIWRYISDGWITQKTKEGEIGSSTMPHKVNPIDFENSEGNLGIANALFGHFSTKLPISRLQRDLSDSTVERNFGTAFAHCLVAYASMFKGLNKISAYSEKVSAELEQHQEVLAEALQTILRREGVSMPYEELKKLTRGKRVTKKDFVTFINKLKVSKDVKKELLAISPETYIGLASTLAADS
jgi:adenylosuccinate lyase